LPLLRCGIFGYARSDAVNLFRRGWARASSLGLILIIKITVQLIKLCSYSYFRQIACPPLQIGGQQRIGDIIKCRQIAGDFDCHADAAVRRGAYHPIEHVLDFTGSHWMLPSGKCLRRIAPAAAMVNEFVETTQNTNKRQLLTSNYGTFRALVNSENFIPQNGPSTRVINATSFV